MVKQIGAGKEQRFLEGEQAKNREKNFSDFQKQKKINVKLSLSAHGYSSLTALTKRSPLELPTRLLGVRELSLINNLRTRMLAENNLSPSLFMLTDDPLIHILGYLSLGDRKVVCGVCKYLQALMNDPIVIKRQLVNSFPDRLRIPGDASTSPPLLKHLRLKTDMTWGEKPYGPTDHLFLAFYLNKNARNLEKGRVRLPRTLLTKSHEEKAQIIGMAWCPDGRHLISTSVTGDVTKWDSDHPGKGEHICSLQSGQINSAAAWHPQGFRLALGSMDGTVRVWDLDLSTRENKCVSILHSGEDSPIKKLAWSPNGECLVSVSENGMATLLHNQISSEKEGKIPAHNEGKRTCLSWNSDGKYLALGSKSGIIEVRDSKRLDDQEGLVRTLKHSTGWTIECVTWQPGRNVLASASMDGLIRLWNLDKKEGEEPITSLTTRHGSGVKILVWGPEARVLASCFLDGTIRFWDPKRPKFKMCIGILQKVDSPCTDLLWGPTGKLVSSHRSYPRDPEEIPPQHHSYELWGYVKRPKEMSD